MKLKILPANLREKKRYLAFEAVSEEPLVREEVILIVNDAAERLYGACGTSQMDLWVLKVWRCNVSHQNILRGIVRCRRETVNDLRAVLPTITQFKGRRVVFSTLGISGTIKSAVKKFIILKKQDEVG